jgi:hypothetical protein
VKNTGLKKTGLNRYILILRKTHHREPVLREYLNIDFEISNNHFRTLEPVYIVYAYENYRKNFDYKNKNARNS